MWELLLDHGNIIVSMLLGVLFAGFSSYLWIAGIKLLDFMMKFGHILHKWRFAIIYSNATDLNKEFLSAELKRANESHPNDGNDIMEEAYIIAGGKRWVCPLCMAVYLSIFWAFPLTFFLCSLDLVFGMIFLVSLWPMMWNNYNI